MRKKALLSTLFLFFTSPSNAFELTISQETWARALQDLRSEMTNCRQGKEDCFSDAWIDFIAPENLTYQGIPAWMEASRKLTAYQSSLEKNLDYLQSPTMQEKAKAYAQKYQKELWDAYQATCDSKHPPVPPSAVVAVKCIETGLKDYKDLALYPVLATLVSLAVFEKQYVLDEVFDQNMMPSLDQIDEADLTVVKPKQEFVRDQEETAVIRGKLFHNKVVNGDYLQSAGWKASASERSSFFKAQVYDLLNVAQRLNWSPQRLLNLKGSYAGAFSTSQVMPSTLLPHLVSDPSFDPDSMACCFKFTAMELQRLGWGEKQPEDVFYGYNHSTSYKKYCAKMQECLHDPVCSIVGIPAKRQAVFAQKKTSHPTYRKKQK